MSFNSISPSEYNSYYQTYIDAISMDFSITEGLNQNLGAVVAFFSNIPVDKQNYRYAEGKWSVKDILLHIIDTERIFAYRALCISRHDKTPLPGFEHNDYVVHALAKTDLSIVY